MKRSEGESVVVLVGLQMVQCGRSVHSEDDGEPLKSFKTLHG